MRTSKSVLATLALLTAAVLTCTTATSVEPTASKIDPSLLVSLKSAPSEPTTALIRLKPRTSDHLKTLRLLNDLSTRSDRINYVVSTLRAFTSESQRGILNYLQTVKTTTNAELTIEPLWSTNIIIIRNADLGTVLSAASFPEVDSIIGEQVYHLDTPTGPAQRSSPSLDPAPEADLEETPWGISRVQAPEVWNTGNRGQGVIVATVDSGVRGTHEALASNFAGDYGWYDPYGSRSLEPFDDDNHGTHVTATIVGTTHNIGVAPGAKWAACKGCITALCYLSQLLKCGEWIACPTLADGTAEDCSQAPHVVSNSWGGAAGDDWYYDTIATYRAVGIIPVFAAGNMGPKCSSVGSPSDYENVISVGGVAVTGELSWFTSFGPVVNGTEVKPEFVAPASNVLSASNKSDREYLYQNGTSMACPHLAGVVALVLAENPNLTFDQVKQVLVGGVAKDVPSSGIGCGGVSEDEYPNNHVGHGRVDAFRAIEYLKAHF